MDQEENSYLYRSGGEYIYGVTRPISLATPSSEDLRATKELEDALRSLNLFESEAGCKMRENVMSQLNRLLEEWTYELGIEMGMTSEEAKTASGRMFTFGSYRLGCVTPGSDIDALSVVPRHVRRDNFFALFYAKLESHPKVKKLQSIPNAYTPIIKVVFENVDVDLLFARIPIPALPPELNTLCDDTLLKNVDEKSVRSLNGCRVADAILSLVPCKNSFRLVLRFIKFWASRRGVYSNVLGYLGGVSYAILVGRICQLYPNYSSSQLINRFFRIYEKWQWKNPVVLCKIKEPNNTPGLMAFKIWNPKTQVVDRQHIMPIITPAFPSMNTTHNVTNTTKKILISEFQLSQQLLQDPTKSWLHLLAPFPFFRHFRHFLIVQIFAATDPIHARWQGWIESKVRLLIRKLEMIHHLSSRPWPTIYRFNDEENGWVSASSLFLGLSFTKVTSEQTIDLRTPISEFIQLINAWPEMGEDAGKVQMKVKHLKRSDLPSYVNEKKRVVSSCSGKSE